MRKHNHAFAAHSGYSKTVKLEAANRGLWNHQGVNNKMHQLHANSLLCGLLARAEVGGFN